MFFPQVTFDVAWSPKSIDRRCYNYTGIADACDFLFVMSYDEQSQIWSECIAAANAPLNQTLAGKKSKTDCLLAILTPTLKYSDILSKLFVHSFHFKSYLKHVKTLNLENFNVYKVF